MSKVFAGRPFSLVRSVRDGRPVTAARFVCGCCHRKLEFKVDGGKSVNPEAVTKLAAEKDWDVSPRSERVRCPVCVDVRKGLSQGERPNKPSAEVIQMQQPAKPAAVVPRPLTPEERLKVRGALDGHFDDAKGRYLDGFSDQRIAEELKVPRIHVETIREAAYGPIKVDPELARLRAELEVVRGEIQALEQRCAGMAARVVKLEGSAAA